MNIKMNSDLLDKAVDDVVSTVNFLCKKLTNLLYIFIYQTSKFSIKLIHKMRG